MSDISDTYPIIFAVFGPLAAAAIVCTISYCIYAASVADYEAKAKVQVEAIKAGLVQDQRGVWVRPWPTPAESPPKGQP
jgi:hypothetical protein